MISLRLAPADLTRVRFADRLHPVGTAILACQALRDPATAAATPDLVRSGAARAAATCEPLRHLLPAQGLLPDFLTPYHGLESVAAGIEAIRATPRQRIRDEVARAYATVATSPWRRRFAAADPEVLDLLTAALRRFFDTGLAPQWSDLSAAYRSQVARAAQTYALTGVDGLLAGLHPAIRWHPPVLTIDTWWSAEVHGTGAGVLLLPSPFAGPRPRVLVRPGQPVLLVYPIAVPAPARPATSTADPLVPLLGRTRALVLRLLGEAAHTTTALSRRAGISLSSASEHASTLRAAGLVVSSPAGGAVVHRLTPLGVHLLARDTLLGPEG